MTRGGLAYAMGEASVTQPSLSYWSRLYVLQANKAVFSVLANATDEDTLVKCQSVVDGLLASLALAKPAPATAGTTEAPAKGSVETTDVPRGKGLAGVWMGIEMPVNSAPYTHYLSFYEDGVYYHDIPREGYVGFSRNSSRNDPNVAPYWGSYTMSGSEGEAHRPGVTRKMPIKIVKSDEIEYDHTHYYKCAPVNGLKLDGAWTSWTDPKDPALKRPGAHPTLHFTKQGRFRDDGLWQLFLGIGEDEQKKAPGAGTYELRDWTLILRYDDGRVRTAAFSMFLRAPAAPSPEMLFVQRTRLNRVP